VFCLGMHCNVMLRFMVHVLQDPPLCSSIDIQYLHSSPCLSLQLDDRDFEELRSQLGGRVCRYLTCDRQEEARRGLSTAAGLLVVLLAAAVIYLTFSYYVVWIVF
jgi:hypothetical protein